MQYDFFCERLRRNNCSVGNSTGCCVKSLYLNVHCPDMLMVRINTTLQQSLSLTSLILSFHLISHAATEALDVPVPVNFTVPVDIGEP